MKLEGQVRDRQRDGLSAMTKEADLFDFLNIPPSHRRNLAIKGWLKRTWRHFYFFVFLSIIAHLALLGMVIILGPEEKVPSPGYE